MRITPGMLVLGGVTVVISFVAAPLTGNSGVLGGPCNQCRGCVMVECVRDESPSFDPRALLPQWGPKKDWKLF